MADRQRVVPGDRRLRSVFADELGDRVLHAFVVENDLPPYWRQRVVQNRAIVAILLAVFGSAPSCD